MSSSSLLTLRPLSHLYSTPNPTSNPTPVPIPKRRASNDASQREKLKLLSFEQLPPWFQRNVNPFVRSGYRPVSHSLLECCRSLTYLHNESQNIYTHLIPAIVTLGGQVWLQLLITQRFPSASALDRSIISLNLLAASVTLALSTTYHTLMNHSPCVSSLFLRVDYIGILTLILGSFLSGIFVGFYRDAVLQRLYWGMMLTLSAITSVLVLHPRLQCLKYRPHRTVAFVATGLSGLAPVCHGLCRYGWEDMWQRSGMPFWFLEGVVYGAGAFFYETRFPESAWPGRFDIWCSSHQIFHVLVFLGASVHMYGVWSAYSCNYQHTR